MTNKEQTKENYKQGTYMENKSKQDERSIIVVTSKKISNEQDKLNKNRERQIGNTRQKTTSRNTGGRRKRTPVKSK